MQVYVTLVDLVDICTCSAENSTIENLCIIIILFLLGGKGGIFLGVGSVIRKKKKREKKREKEKKKKRIKPEFCLGKPVETQTCYL